jgi:hypothetical protein
MAWCLQAEDGGNSLQKWRVAISMQDVWMIGIQKEKSISRNLFIIQTSSSHHYKEKLSNFFSDYYLPK